MFLSLFLNSFGRNLRTLVIFSATVAVTAAVSRHAKTKIDSGVYLIWKSQGTFQSHCAVLGDPVIL